MKNSVAILAILTTVSLSTCLAQATVTTGGPHPVLEAGKKLYFAEGKEILAIKISESTIYLQKFNSESLLVERQKTYASLPRGSHIEKIVKLKNRYLLFYSLWDGEDQNLLYREINFKGGTFTGKDENIFKTKGKISRGRIVNRDFPENRFNISFSADSTKMLVEGRKPSIINNDSKSYDVISIHVYDEGLKMLWGQEVEMPYTERQMDDLSYSVDSKGNVYCVAKIYNKEFVIEQSYRIEILKIEPGKTTVSKTLIGIVGKFIEKIWLYENPAGYMIGAGFYNVGNLYDDNTDGIVVFKLSPEGKMYDMIPYEIPIEIINQYAKHKDVTRKDKFQNFDLNDFIIQPDGSLLLIADQKFSSQGSSITHNTGSGYGGGTSSSSTPPQYFYEDILVTKIDVVGKLAWMKRLPKRQKGEENEIMPFQYAKIQGKHYFLFVDNFKNKDLPTTKKPARHSIGGAGLFTAYSIEDGSGGLSKKTFFDTSYSNGIEIFKLTPSRIVRTSENEFVGEAYKRDEGDILIKIEMQD